MSAELEPVRTRRYPSGSAQIALNDAASLNLYRRPITPPITPISSSCPSRLAESLIGDSLAELLSSRLRAPTHCPAAAGTSQDTKKSGPTASNSAPPQAHSDPESSPPTDTNVSAGLSVSRMHPPPEAQSKTHNPTTSTGDEDIVQPSRVLRQRSATNDTGESSDATTVAPVKLSAVGSEVTRIACNLVHDPVTPASSSTQSLSETVVTVDIASPSVYCRDKKLYVGKMKTLPCPFEVESKWTGEIRPRLIKDLLPVLRILPRSMSSEETIIEPELCMAGYVTCKATTVQLRSTVWIRCGSKKCRKVIRKAVDDLGYLHSFSNGPVEVRIRGPRPATSVHERPTSAEERRCIVNENKILQVQSSASGASACGLRLRVLTDTDIVDYDGISTIGGLVKVEGKIYGLTTAHGILDPPRVAGSAASSVSNSSDSDSSTTSHAEVESEDDSDTSSDTDYLEESSPHRGKDYPGDYDSRGQSAKAQFRERIERLQWKNGTFCGPMNFCGRGSITGGTNDLSTALHEADFALIDMGLSSTYKLFNEYVRPGNSSKSQIMGVRHDDELTAGEVFLLTDQNETTVGHLLDGPALFINRAVVFNTRKIELIEPLPTGMSGTWVVQDNLLCGVIVAVYDADPYAHMITADKIFQDIRNFQPNIFSACEVAIATEDDITRAYGMRETGSASSSNNISWNNTSPNTTNSRYLLLPVVHIEANRSTANLIQEPESSRFDLEFGRHNARRRRKDYFSDAVSQVFRFLCIVFRKIATFFTGLLWFCFTLIFSPVTLLAMGYHRISCSLIFYRHCCGLRLSLFVKGAIIGLFIGLSAVPLGLLVHQLVQIMGVRDFFLRALPFVVAALNLLSILGWLWKTTMRRVKSKSGIPLKMHGESSAGEPFFLRDPPEPTLDGIGSRISVSVSPYRMRSSHRVVKLAE